MISEGTVAPSFELPALVDGERRRVALDDYVGEDVIILAFYPADFNPACDGESCDLDELDLFTMQKDVTILGVSPDSVYSHRAFAEQYSLKVPLLSDTDHDVAREYGIDFVDDIGQQLIERGVVVIDHDGVVQYSWSTDDLTRLPKVEPIKDAIADTGGDDTAFARYRVGHAHYTEGRRAFTSAMSAFRDSEWMMAQGDFQRARDEFAEAEDRFDTALRFVDDDGLGGIYEGAKTKANALWQAADWLAESASDYSSGSGASGQEWREDAERPLETARSYEEPPDPDDWPPEMDDLEKDEEEQETILPSTDEPDDATLDVDIDEAAADEGTADRSEESETQPAPTADVTETPTTNRDETVTAEGDIDDAEIEEIQAELEANRPESEPPPEEITEEPTAMVEAPPESVTEQADDDTDDTADDEDPDDTADDDLAELQAELAASQAESDAADEPLPEESTSMVDAPPASVADGDENADTVTADEPGATATPDAAPPEGGTTATDDPGDETAAGTPQLDGDEGAGASADVATADDEEDDTEAGADTAVAGDDEDGDDSGTVSASDKPEEFGGYVTPDTGPVTGSDPEEDDEDETED